MGKTYPSKTKKDTLHLINKTLKLLHNQSCVYSTGSWKTEQFKVGKVI